jgi:secreted PhoX family phosphatase
MTLRRALLAATALCCASSLAHAGDLSFAPLPFPADDATRRLVVTSASATIDGQTAAIGYNVLARTGDMIGGQMFGQLTDKDGKPLPVTEGRLPASIAPDFTSLLTMGDKIYSLTHFEDLPAAIYLSEVAQGPDGRLGYVSTKPLDLSSIDGLWWPCAGSVTPWGTHLGSEEYPTDARAHEQARTLDDIDEEVRPFARYFGLDDKTMTLDEYRAKVDPYRYGFPVEYTVAADGTAKVAKHYAMGRLSVELANIMPDQKTAYISDDGTNVGLFRYVADTPGDLTAGRLFAAKWVQTSDQDGGAATIEWIDLGHADDATVRAALVKGTRFSDIFDTAEFNADGTCPEGFAGSNAEGQAECLKVKPGMEMIAARLETRRYASMLGATTEFRKMEGSAYNPDANRLYLSMSEVSKGMTDADEKFDKGGRNDIRLAKNPCGAVYELPLGADFVATGMKALVTCHRRRHRSSPE